jgi:radical SAM PhpK family P-methyltransferase
MKTYDCIVVGYNDVPMDLVASKHRPLRQRSGTYSELCTNSVLLEGRRHTYMDLLNSALQKVHGTNPGLNSFEAPNLGAAYLVSFLRRRGFHVEMINLFNTDKERFAELLATSPRAVAITTTYYVDDDPVREIVDFVREHSESTQIVAGGPYIYDVCAGNPVPVQDAFLTYLGADVYIHDSQGEATLAHLLRTFQQDGGDADLSGVPNLIYRDGDEMVRTERKVEQNDLDSNAVDWSFFHPQFVGPTAYMRTCRSCPFSCAFCNFPAMAGEHMLADIEVVRRELRQLVNAGVKYVIFIDDTFNVPLPRFKKLCQMMIDEDFGLKWISFFRCSNADDQCFDLMARSGCLGVYLGVESGDDKVLGFMNKHAVTAKYRYGIQKLHEHGILTFASFIAGYPGETEETFLNSVRFVQETSPTFFNVQLYYHNPITPAERRREEFGLVGDHYSWEHKTMNWQQAKGWVEYMLKNVTNSIPLTLQAFSIWSLPYLMQNGLTVEQVKDFARTARKMLIKSLDDVEDDYREEWSDMASALAGWNPGHRHVPPPPLLA